MVAANNSIVYVLLQLASLAPLVLIIIALLVIQVRKHGVAEVFARRFTITLVVYLPLVVGRLFLLPLMMRAVSMTGLGFALLNNFINMLVSAVLWLGLIWSILGLPPRSYFPQGPDHLQ